MAGFAGTVFADNASNDSDSIPEHTCNYPICLLEDENFKEPTQGSDFVIKVQVEPETKFTARIFDTKYDLTYIESVLADSDGIARIAYPIPHDAKNGDYEVTYTSYTSNGAVHSGLLLQVDNRFTSHDETEFRTHASSSTAGSVATAVLSTLLLCGTIFPALRTMNISPT